MKKFPSAPCWGYLQLAGAQNKTFISTMVVFNGPVSTEYRKETRYNLNFKHGCQLISLTN